MTGSTTKGTEEDEIVVRLEWPDDAIFVDDPQGTFERDGLVLEIGRGTLREVARALSTMDDEACACVVPFDGWRCGDATPVRSEVVIDAVGLVHVDADFASGASATVLANREWVRRALGNPAGGPDGAPTTVPVTTGIDAPSP